MSYVFGTLMQPDGLSPVVNRVVTVTVPYSSDLPEDQATVIGESTVRTDDTGSYVFNLTPLPDNHYYVITLPLIEERVTLLVPAHDPPAVPFNQVPGMPGHYGWWVNTLRVDDVPVVPPLRIGVQTVTGVAVDNSDPFNPIINQDSAEPLDFDPTLLFENSLF